MQAATEYIFSINTGRAGSNYLTNIFSHAVGCGAFHEPEPLGNGRVIRCFFAGDHGPARQCAQEKLQKIQEAKRSCQVYVETTNCFIKGFGWFLPQHIPQEQIGVVILKRSADKIVESFSRLHALPLNPRGRRWFILPNAKAPLLPPPSIFLSSPKLTYLCARGIRLQELARHGGKLLLKKMVAGQLPWLTPDEITYQLGPYVEERYPGWLQRYEQDCMHWYVHETYKQAAAFQQRYSRITYYEVNLEDLNSPKAVQQMFAAFGLQAKASLADIVGRPTNLKR